MCALTTCVVDHRTVLTPADQGAFLGQFVRGIIVCLHLVVQAVDPDKGAAAAGLCLNDVNSWPPVSQQQVDKVCMLSSLYIQEVRGWVLQGAMLVFTGRVEHCYLFCRAPVDTKAHESRVLCAVSYATNCSHNCRVTNDIDVTLYSIQHHLETWFTITDR